MSTTIKLNGLDQDDHDLLVQILCEEEYEFVSNVHVTDGITLFTVEIPGLEDEDLLDLQGILEPDDWDYIVLPA